MANVEHDGRRYAVPSMLWFASIFVPPKREAKQADGKDTEPDWTANQDQQNQQIVHMHLLTTLAQIQWDAAHHGRQHLRSSDLKKREVDEDKKREGAAYARDESFHDLSPANATGQARACPSRAPGCSVHYDCRVLH